MAEPSSGAPPRVGMAPEDRLDSWKEIVIERIQDHSDVVLIDLAGP